MAQGIKIVIVDDHVVLRNGLAELIRKLGYTVLFEAGNGKEFIDQLDESDLPDLVLMDINMPTLDGFETTLCLKEHHPEIKVLALSMYDDEIAIIRMIRSGARGYILKESDTPELNRAINNLLSKGFHYSEIVTGSLIHAVSQPGMNKQTDHLSERELEFLKWASTELTYKEIAREMKLSPRTIDGYRELLFEKLNVRSRIGLVLYAIRNKITYVNQY